jgi:hypothetical protein
MAMANLERTGGCVCGAVRFTCQLTDTGLQACHCVQCQRWTGGGPLINVHVETLTFEDESAIGTYHASDWGERCFCSKCGSTLCWKMQGKPSRSVAVGLLDDQTELAMSEEIFVDRRPDWLPVWPAAGQSTEAQEIVKLQDYLEGEKNDQV